MELGFRITIVSGIPDSLNCIVDSKAQDSGFQSLVEYWIPWTVFWIPKLRIPDSRGKNFSDLRTRIPYHGATNYSSYITFSADSLLQKQERISSIVALQWRSNWVDVQRCSVPLTHAILWTLWPWQDGRSCSLAWDADAALVVGLKGAPVAQSTWSQASWRERTRRTGDWRKEQPKIQVRQTFM